ncbi:MAG: hypothetical protein GEU96_17660 [Propionibacteriales bacterium]|nr:hypothetical protein [Propionibacteriales bacterium]
MTPARHRLMVTLVAIVLLALAFLVSCERSRTVAPRSTVTGEGSMTLGRNAPPATGRTSTGTDQGDGSGSGNGKGHGKGDGKVEEFDVYVNSLDGLFPGADTPVRVRFSNPFSFDIRVTRVEVTSVGSTGCPPTYLKLGTYDLARPVVLEKRGAASTEVPFGMQPSAPDSCQGLTFPLVVTAQAVKR